MLIYLLRHGRTEGNLLGRYIGTTDEPLTEEGLLELQNRGALPPVDALYVSPLRRCRQSAQILYPDMPQHIVEDFRECDFGLFENKNYRELDGNPEYQRWIDSGGTLPFPGGESREEFQERCVEAFQKVLLEAAGKRYASIACVVHGGTIMSILARLDREKRDYFSYHVDNGCGYALEWKNKTETMFGHPIDFTVSVCYDIGRKL